MHNEQYEEETAGDWGDDSASPDEYEREAPRKRRAPSRVPSRGARRAYLVRAHRARAAQMQRAKMKRARVYRTKTRVRGAMPGAAYTLRVRQQGDWYIACLDVNIGKDMNIGVKAKVSASAIARILNQTYRGSFGGMAGAENVSGFFGSIFKAIKKVVKKVAKSKVFKAATKIFRSPIFKGIAAAIPGVNIAVGALTAADMASKAARGLFKSIKKRRGKRGKRARIPRRGQSLARAASPRGRKYFRAMKKLAAAQAKRRKVPFAMFQRAWKSGINAVPDPRLVYLIRVYPGPVAPSQRRAMFMRMMPVAQARYQQQLPGFMRAYAF